MSAHTPGPWVRREWTRHAMTTVGIADPLACGGFQIVAECERAEDAQLIQAAPALLAAAQAARLRIAADRTSLAECHTGPDGLDDAGAAGAAEYDAVIQQIDAAIALMETP